VVFGFSTVRKLAAGAMIGGALLMGACQSMPMSDNSASMQLIMQEPLDASPWSFNKAPGNVIATEHYRIYTTVRDPLYQRLLGKVLEATYDRAQAFRPTEKIKKPLECYVFADREQWALYTRLRAGSNATVYLQIAAGGYCQDGVFAGYDIGRNRTLSVVAHEAWHQYSSKAFDDRLPSWVDEGLATQNESLRWDGVTPTFAPELNYDRFQALVQAQQRGMLVPFSQITTSHAGQVVKNQDKAKAYYAQLWSMLLFLEHTPKYRAGLVRMLDDARDGKLNANLKGTGVTPAEIANLSEHWNQVAGPKYMKVYINPNMEELEAEYRAFVKEFTASWPPKLPTAN
jgi:hypothetical protein